MTKLAGEQHVMNQLDRAFVFRTAWVYSKDGKNFVNTMLRLASERDEISVVDDQYGSPTLADDLAAMTIGVIDQMIEQPTATKLDPRFGIYHATGGDTTNWYGFTREIMRISGNGHVNVKPIPGSQYPTPAPRPDYSVLSNKKLLETFGLSLPDWRDGLARCLDRAN